MAQIMHINSNGWYGLRKTTGRASMLRARIKATPELVHIELSDGRQLKLDRDRQISFSSLMAGAIQWARRHGADAIEVETS